MAKTKNQIIPEDKFVGKQTVQTRKRDFRILLIILLAAFLILSILVKLQPLLPIDVFITQFIQRVNSPWFDILMRSLTFLGNAIPLTVSIIFFALCLFLMNREKESLLLIVSCFGATTISTIAKIVVSRPRPDSSLINQVGTFANSDSFPSGHVLAFIGLYGFLVYLVFTRLKMGLFRTALINAGLVLLFLISISRIYLGAHWFSDTLGSYLIGGAWIYIMILIDNRFKSSTQK